MFGDLCRIVTASNILLPGWRLRMKVACEACLDKTLQRGGLPSSWSHLQVKDLFDLKPLEEYSVAFLGSVDRSIQKRAPSPSNSEKRFGWRCSGTRL